MPTIRVVVQDDRKRPIAGARLRVARDGDREGRTVSSDASGVAAVDVNQTGAYAWSVDAPGHRDASGRFRVRGRGQVEGAPGVVELQRLASISGGVTGEGTPLQAITVHARQPASGLHSTSATSAAGTYRIGDLRPGPWNVSVDAPSGMQPANARSIRLKPGENRAGIDFALRAVHPPLGTGPSVPSGPPSPPPPPIVTGPAASGPVVSGPLSSGPVPTEPPVPPPPTPSGPVPPSDDAVAAFLRLLDDPGLSIEQPINEEEAEEAISFFAVSNIVLSVGTRVRINATPIRDVLGVLALYYGLRDRTIQQRIFVKTKTCWLPIQDRLKILRDRLDVLGSDLAFLEREARRQFNVGWSNDVIGNLRFTALFNRYVEIAASPLLAQDLRAESSLPRDPVRTERTFDLLVELKGVVLALVRSLSHYGTVATRESNVAWARVSTDALKVLDDIAKARVSDDIDDRNLFAVLADATGTRRDALLPRVVMAKHGAPMLRIAMDAYREAKLALDDLSREHLLHLFQPQGDPANYRTEKLRQHAVIVRRYPVATWQ